MYIYLDESGDLGFNEKSSKYFVIAVLATNDSKAIETALQKYRKKLRNSPKKKRNLGEYKFNKAPDKVKTDLLNIINLKKVELGYVFVDKVHVYQKLREKRNELYTYMCRTLLDKFLVVSSLSNDSKIDLIVDRQFAKKHRENFNNYLDWKIKELVELKMLNIFHKDSQQELCLQAVDFVCGATYRCYNLDDPKYFEIIKKKIIIKHEMWK